ncbi:MAG: amino acid ABC transporter permease [Rhodobacteraceae bacterium]|nr:amino acid ABC transporter permease [Paracoccaceae bacterium]
MPSDIPFAFVRKEQLPQLPPPAREQGAVKWIRENLFSGPVNSLLTVLSVMAIYYLVMAVWPWLFNGIWHTQSLRECQDILQGRTGACFSVLTQRWYQLLYGFSYPGDQYWRPNLAFLLLGAAAAPVMFTELPRKMLLFTAVYPFIAFYLIWGGTIWSPIFALSGFVAGYFVYARFVAQSFAGAVGGAILAAIVVWTLGGYITNVIAPVEPVLQAIPSRDLGGFMLNFMLGVTCVSLALPLGIVLALGRQSTLPFIKLICVVFIEFIRGVPLITLLFVANVMLSYFFPPNSTVDLFLRVVIMITMFAAAYIAEVIRGGLAALPRGQYEAADSLGLDYPQAMRLIILPQALKISIPGIVNVAVGLFKDTTLVSVISMFDLVGMIRGPILAQQEWNGVYWELFLFASVLFFIVCYSISQYSQWLERKLATDRQ